MLSLEHNSHNEHRSGLSRMRVDCARNQASINHQNFPKRYIEKTVSTCVVAMHTIAACRPDMDSYKRERAVESIRSSYGPLTTISSTHTQIIFRPETSVLFFSCPCPCRPSLSRSLPVESNDGKHRAGTPTWLTASGWACG